MKRVRFNISGVSLAIVVSSGCIGAAMGPDAFASSFFVFIVLLSVVLFGLRHSSPSLARRLARALVFAAIVLLLAFAILVGDVHLVPAFFMFFCAFPLYLSL